MKAYVKNLFLMPAMIAGVCLIPTGQLKAQTFTTLHHFSYANDGGTLPTAGLILSGNTLYGTAERGGISGNGTVFTINTNGTGFTALHRFSVTNGALPNAVILSGNTLYGTTQEGGTSGKGTVFKVNTDGTGFTNLHRFSGLSGGFNFDGANPRAGVVLAGNTLYGTTHNGGGAGEGTVFAINTNGSGFMTLHSFTNNDGANASAGLIIGGDALFGTTENGGDFSRGAVFKINTNGTSFTTLHSFSALSFSTNSDGAKPIARLLLSGNTLYGTTYEGGASGKGTVFRVNTNGTGFTNLHSFPAVFQSTNSDGANPSAGLILSGNTLYGTAAFGGNGNNGTVFAVNTDGTDFTTLHKFDYDEGALPHEVVLSGDTLFGAAQVGGTEDGGTVFSLALFPLRLTITRSEADVILTWPTYAPGFTLQSTTNLSSTNWSVVPDAPVVVNGQKTVTNAASETQEFYRLSQ